MQQMLERLIQSPYADSTHQRKEVLDLLVAVAWRLEDHEQHLHWATEKADLCRSLGHQTEAHSTEADIGVALVEMGHEAEGFGRIDNAIASLAHHRRFAEMDACVTALKRKINALSTLERYDEIMPTARATCRTPRRRWRTTAISSPCRPMATRPKPTPIPPTTTRHATTWR